MLCGVFIIATGTLFARNKLAKFKVEQRDLKTANV